MSQRKRALLSARIEAARLETVRPHVRGKVLDIGCANGSLLRMIPAIEGYLGADHDERFLERARHFFPERKFVALDIEQGDLAPLKAEAPFDTIVMLALLEHLAQPAKVLGRLQPLLAPGGLVVATTPTPFGHRVHAFGARLGLFSREAAEDHEVMLDRKALEAAFGAAGLTVRSYRTFQAGCNQTIVAGRA